MTADMIMMLSTLEHFCWSACDGIYAFPSDETDESQTNGTGTDIWMQYRFTFNVNLRPNPERFGYYTVTTEIDFDLPFGADYSIPPKSVHSVFDLHLDFLREKGWAEFVNHLQSEFLSHEFWQDRRRECESFFLTHSLND
jgi:hypothetical protein